MTSISKVAMAMVVSWVVLLSDVDSLLAADDVPPSKVLTLVSQQLPDHEGKIVDVVSVTYPPGGASKPHRHPGHVFVYVVQGTVTTQVEGEEETTYEAGQSWYEPPMVLHKISKNASDTESAKLVAFLLLDADKPTVIPEK